MLANVFISRFNLCNKNGLHFKNNPVTNYYFPNNKTLHFSDGHKTKYWPLGIEQIVPSSITKTPNIGVNYIFRMDFM